jgi:hypothetical protein
MRKLDTLCKFKIGDSSGYSFPRFYTDHYIKVKDFRVWNQALNQKEIRFNQFSGVTKHTVNLAAYYKFTPLSYTDQVSTFFQPQSTYLNFLSFMSWELITDVDD